MSQKKNQQKKTNLLNFQMLYDNILVKAIIPDKVSGLVRPAQYDDKAEFGVVVSCGEGRLLDDGTVVPLKVEPGDTIFFGKYSSSETRSEGQDYLIIKDDDIMAVYKE